MIGALVAILSLNLTSVLVTDYGVIAASLPVTGATATTPIELTSTGHGYARPVHGLVSGVTGTAEANGLWVLTPVDPNTLALSTFTAQGIPVQSVGVNAYVSGGIIQLAFPDGSILLGRRNVALATSVASPRIVFVPTDGKAWSFEPYVGAAPSITPASVPNVRGSVEQQSMTLGPQMATEFTTFEVYVSGSGPNYGNELSPDFYDLDATQSIVFALYSVCFDASGARAKVLHESWPSQSIEAGTQTQRGQQWKGVIEFQQPVIRIPTTFVPIGTSLQITVEPVNPYVTDPVVIDINPA
jgi:hypothetical protein